MTKKAAVGLGAAGAVIVGLLIYFMLQTLRQQADFAQQLEALKKQNNPGAATASTAPAPVPAPILTAVTTQDGSALSKEKLTQEYLAQGFRLLNARDRASAQQAASIFREGIDKIDNTNVFFYNGLGRALLLTGQYDDALHAFNDGLKVDPRRAELISGRGWAFWNLKQYAQAKQAWQDAIALDPKSEDAWMVMAWVYLALGDDENSKKGFVILLASDSSRKEWLTGLNMARGNNHNIDQIRGQFPGMPDPSAFTAPATAAAR